MLRYLTRCGALMLGALVLGSCDLEVVNPDDPDAERVLASASDLENLLNYRRWHSGLYGSTGVFWGMASGQSFENYSSLANNCQNQRNSIPRAINDNSVGNGCNGEQQRVYYFHNEVMRTAATVLTRLEDPEFTLGSDGRDARARSFAQFLRGLSLGYLALFYDSSAVISPGMSPEDPGVLVGYREVLDSSMAALESAIQHANDPDATLAGGFPIPDSWLPSPTSWTPSEFIRLIRSYRARLRANVARTPSDPVNWDLVIADVQNGITSDHLLTTNTNTGPTNNWVQQWYSYGTWHQMTPFVIGMADNSGSYADWIALDLNVRGASGSFFMTTPDQRFPQGDTRADQQADFSVTMCSAAATPCKRYFRNRPSGNDQNVGLGWGWSNYDHARFYSWRFFGDGGNAANGDFPFITKAEMDLLEAEGHIRNADYALALPLINNTREANGELPPLVAADNTTPAPGGNDCVPKVPQPPNFDTLACGNMEEAMKYEKRIETAYTHFAAWFLDMRRWGDLAETTPLYWAVPYRDLQARGWEPSEIYSTGLGTTAGSWAPSGTYGW